MPDRPLSILIVDDESTLREALTRSFRREGHETLAVRRRPRGDRPRQHRHVRRRPARRRARPRPRRLRGLPHAARAPQHRPDHHAHRARHRGRHGASASRPAPTTTWPSPSASPSCAAASAPCCAAPARGPSTTCSSAARWSSTAARASCAATAIPVQLTFSEFEVMSALMSAPGPAVQPAGADARDLGRLRLPRPARDRRARAPPAREAGGASPDRPELILTVRGAGYRLAA